MFLSSGWFSIMWRRSVKWRGDHRSYNRNLRNCKLSHPKGFQGFNGCEPVASVFNAAVILPLWATRLVHCKQDDFAFRRFLFTSELQLRALPSVFKPSVSSCHVCGGLCRKTMTSKLYLVFPFILYFTRVMTLSTGETLYKISLLWGTCCCVRTAEFF